MESLQIIQQQKLLSESPTHFMSPRLTPKLFFHTSSQLRSLLCTPPPPPPSLNLRRGSVRVRVRVKVEVSNAQLKENWLASLTSPFPQKPADADADEDSGGGINLPSNEWIIGIDPDLSGALALLKTDHSGCCTAQVFDAPYLQVLVGKRLRRRLDANSIVKLLHSFNAPIGTTAYLEQSIPFPQDGKQGWWSGGFGYGLWIGVLVASGFSVVPVPSLIWKNKFELVGNRSNKDDSRRVASTLFPSMSSLLKRKKDHGRAEALLIAAYGKSLKLNSNSLRISEELAP